jgi:hypothetical protein
MPVLQTKVYFVEDHHQVLPIWRKKNILSADLVHIDAHVDFAYQQALPAQEAFFQAKSQKELKNSLEHSLNFMHYEKDFNKQVNIGNYIYWAMKECIVKDFYWVIPGGHRQFKKSSSLIKKMLKDIRAEKFSLSDRKHIFSKKKKDIISA